jgi:Prokaryotic dksA/traR C4-type zinc finger
VASGWAPDRAFEDQIDDTVTDEVMRAWACMPTGEGQTHCVECGDAIPEARRRVLPGDEPASNASPRGTGVRRASGSIAEEAKTASLNRMLSDMDRVRLTFLAGKRLRPKRSPIISACPHRRPWNGRLELRGELRHSRDLGLPTCRI